MIFLNQPQENRWRFFFFGRVANINKTKNLGQVSYKEKQRFGFWVKHAATQLRQIAP